MTPFRFLAQTAWRLELLSLDKKKLQVEQHAGWRDLESSIRHIKSLLFPEFSVKAQLHFPPQIPGWLSRSRGSDGLYKPSTTCFIEDNKENHSLYAILLKPVQECCSSASHSFFFFLCLSYRKWKKTARGDRILGLEILAGNLGVENKSPLKCIKQVKGIPASTLKPHLILS